MSAKRGVSRRQFVGSAAAAWAVLFALLSLYWALGGTAGGGTLGVEIERLATSETVGIVIPTENFNAGKTQFANARRLIGAGCAVALSTDYNPGSAPCPSQPMTMATCPLPTSPR